MSQIKPQRTYGLNNYLKRKKGNSMFTLGRFYYDKSTKKTLYNIHTIEIKTLRCIHQGEREWDGNHFTSFNVFILNWKK